MREVQEYFNYVLLGSKWVLLWFSPLSFSWVTLSCGAKALLSKGTWWTVDGCFRMAGTIGRSSVGKRARIYIVKRGKEIRRGFNDVTRFSTYNVKAHGLQDLLIITEARLVQFSPARPTRQSFLLICPWNHRDLELPDFDDLESLGPEPGSSSELDMGDLRLIVRLGQPFGALLLVQQWGGEFKRITLDNNIITQVKDVTSVDSMMHVRTLEIL
ncbi:uncharacterized protein F5147DRAFT_658265 [Suillus discolor]|uniref:Uncharacterized protein n=1 Tax=Suillus discolor TaxID=1912936 RepID=A0A9P7ETD1_9AGAM|nr:uncharacterized protein F5147DRAFT_658265 [Suillus discolor]KAG2089997.1 hypothetical protein F5147DRAFT_658265 [Suillus discolor]